MSLRESELLFWVALLETCGVGLRTAHRLRAALPAISNAFLLSGEEWTAFGVEPHTAQRLALAFRDGRAAETVRRIDREGLRYILLSDPEYPPLLKEISAPPPYLFYTGEWRVFPVAVAVVGTRRSTLYGRRVAYEVARDLGEGGAAVVSGLAAGADRSAHEGALDGGGATVAVLGSGIREVYPRGHAGLAEQIAARGGLVVSEFLPWDPPARHRFPQRNRIISGLSSAVVVVEAGLRSGALITAAFALEQDRDVFAVPGSIYSQASDGTNGLLAEGAAPLLSTRAVLESLGLTACGARPGATDTDAAKGKDIARLLQDASGNREARAVILQELSAVPRTLWELLDLPGIRDLPAESMKLALAKMELEGDLERDEWGRLSVRAPGGRHGGA